MIFPGAPSDQGSWVAVAALVVVLTCLVFVFYKAAARRAHSTPPKSHRFTTPGGIQTVSNDFGSAILTRKPEIVSYRIFPILNLAMG